MPRGGGCPFSKGQGRIFCQENTEPGEVGLPPPILMQGIGNWSRPYLSSNTLVSAIVKREINQIVKEKEQRFQSSCRLLQYTEAGNTTPWLDKQHRACPLPAMDCILNDGHVQAQRNT
uniref:Uncharacterized protein n=1 Tax=Micrurus lemniscatus lemniscatus TaxID=129467 RepID=A0A2D4II65_MICLE